MCKSKHKVGFTLIEVIIAIMLVGLAIVGIVAASGSLTTINGVGIEMSTAEFLIEQIRENFADDSFDSVIALNGIVFSPPIDATGTALTDFAHYSQSITVVNVNNNDLTQIDGSGTSDFRRITVEILLGSKTINSGSWIKADY